MQTAYGNAMAAAFAGLLADLRDNLVESFACEGDRIPFGHAVLAGTDKQKQVILAAEGSTALFRGIAVHTHAHGVQPDGEDGYADTQTVNVLRRGMIWVPVSEAVAIDAAAFYINAPGSGDEDLAGQFTDTDDGTSLAVPTGVFRSSTTAAGLALLEINLP